MFAMWIHFTPVWVPSREKEMVQFCKSLVIGTHLTEGRKEEL